VRKGERVGRVLIIEFGVNVRARNIPGTQRVCLPFSQAPKWGVLFQGRFALNDKAARISPGHTESANQFMLS